MPPYVSELFDILLYLTGKTKLIYSTNTQQDASLKDYLMHPAIHAPSTFNAVHMYAEQKVDIHE
jgi:hypothetical protein